ncbi:MAG: response regulator transcription factor [Cyanobacteria bacterium SIG32]|nr:response regulator transcription factor [Cyanobacteria bacterium SIG32]
MDKLSDREKDVLFYLVKGYNNKQIGKVLSISHHTVKAHVSALIRRFECSDRTEVAYLAGKYNII